MTNGNDNGKKIGCGEIKKPTMSKTIDIIRDTGMYNDDDARTCFWLWVEGLNGDPNKKTDLVSVLKIMKEKRPDAHEVILKNASLIIITE